MKEITNKYPILLFFVFVELENIFDIVEYWVMKWLSNNQSEMSVDIQTYRKKSVRFEKNLRKVVSKQLD